MIRWSRHLDDTRIHECYFNEHGGESMDPRAADHFAECPRCAARYRELASFMDGLSAEAALETAQVFTPERLQLQQQQIARRLDLLGHAARVITFPSRLAADTAQAGRMASAAIRIAPRWLAAAAAAGLFVGMVVGSFYDFGVRPTPRPPSPAASLRSSPQPPVSMVPPPNLARPVDVSSNDEAFLSQIELALGGPRTRELQPFDAMTPRVQEISTRLR